VDFVRQSSVIRRPLSYGEPSFDPSEASHASFDVEMYAAPSQRNSAAMSRPKSMWGATVAISLQLKAGRFVVEEVRQAATGKLNVGDEVVKIDGLPLHVGMTLEEAEEMLAGPDGSMVELEVRSTKGALAVMDLPRERRGMMWQDMEEGDSQDKGKEEPDKKGRAGAGETAHAQGDMAMEQMDSR
jgi:C-terminal processing protease CtpA/Prc